MPPYPGLFTGTLNFETIESHVGTMAMLGVPYGDMVEKGKASEAAKEQAKTIADDIAANGGPQGLEDKDIVALIAYLQRLGVDIKHADEMATRPTHTVGGF